MKIDESKIYKDVELRKTLQELGIITDYGSFTGKSHDSDGYSNILDRVNQVEMLLNGVINHFNLRMKYPIETPTIVLVDNH